MRGLSEDGKVDAEAGSRKSAEDEDNERDGNRGTPS